MRCTSFGAQGRLASAGPLPTSCHISVRGHPRQEGSARGHTHRARASQEESSRDGGSRDDSPAISEDILAKLRQYEEENRKLKDRLEDKEAPAASSSDSERSRGRIDGDGLKRESFFGTQERKSWLSEGDIDFFTGGKPGEIVNESMKMSAQEQGVVRRRIVIALGLTAATVAFANVPTEVLDGSANKPAAAYLVPVLRSIDLLDDVARDIKETGEMDALPRAINSILKKPNEARKNMYTAIEYLDRGQQQAARELVGSFVDLVQQADSQSYFDTKGPKDGKLMQQYQDFSLQSLKAAARDGRAFVKLFNYSSVNEARAMLQDAMGA